MKNKSSSHGLWPLAAALLTACALILLAAAPAAAILEWFGLGEEPKPPAAVICLDPGHGGLDRGVWSPSLQEKDLDYALCRRIRAMLEQRGYKVFFTRSGDVAMPIEERTGVANNGHADLLVSIHTNSGTAETARGPRIYTFAEPGPEPRKRPQAPGSRGWRQVPPTVRSEGEKLARALATAFEQAQRPAVAVLPAPLLILEGARMPAVVVEVGVLPGGAADLAREATQQQIAAAVTKGIDLFFHPQGGQSAPQGQQAPQGQPAPQDQQRPEGQ